MPVGSASWSFTQDDFDAITQTLQRFLYDSNARCALLVDRTGQLVATVGEQPNFDPTAFEDSYRAALEQVVAAKLEGVPVPAQEGAETPGDADVVDLVAALKASVEAAKKRREDAGKSGRGSAPGAKSQVS